MTMATLPYSAAMRLGESISAYEPPSVHSWKRWVQFSYQTKRATRSQNLL